MDTLPCTVRAARLEYAIRDVVLPARTLEADGHEILKLNIGDPLKYDYDTPAHIKRAYIAAIERGENGYSDSEGLTKLREAIVHKERRDGVAVERDDIVVTAGVTEALQLIFGALLEPGDELLVPGPTYPPYIAYSSFVGARPISYPTIETEGWQPDPDAIRARITDRTRGIVIISPNNPTGALYNEKTLRTICDIAAEEELPIISDEIYDRLTYEEPFVSPAAVADDVPMILLNGISKVYLAPGWRIGYLAVRDGEGALSAVYDGIQRQARARLCPNTPGQYGYLEALNGSQEFLLPLCEKLKRRRDLVVRRINAIDGLSTQTPAGAFYMFPQVDLDAGGWEDDKAFVLDVLDQCHTLFVHGSGFCPQFGCNHFRLVFLPPEALLNEALDRLEQFMAERIG